MSCACQIKATDHASLAFPSVFVASRLFDGLLDIPPLITNALYDMLSDNDVIHLLQTKHAVADVLLRSPKSYVLKHTVCFSSVDVLRLSLHQTSGVIRIGEITLYDDNPSQEVTNNVDLAQLFANINVSSVYALKLSGLNRPLNAAHLPPSLTSLTLGDEFFQRLTVESLPKSLTELTIKGILCGLDTCALPESLINLSISQWPADCPIQPGTLPSSLRHLICEFGIEANVAPYALPLSMTELNGLLLVAPNILPAALTTLIFSDEFNQELTMGLLPDSITHLHLGRDFNQMLAVGVLPNSITKLSLGYNFNHVIPVGVLPSQLRRLYMSHSFDQQLQVGVFPPTLELLEFVVNYNDNYSSYNHPLHPRVLPDGLRELTLSESFNQPLEAGVFPPSLTLLIFGLEFNQPINDNVLPPMLTRLFLPCEYEHRITVKLPRTLISFQMQGNDIPTSIIQTLME